MSFASPAAPGTKRLKIAIRGAVQGVGFRPFIHRLATELHLTGWVRNSAAGVLIEVEGPSPSLEQFLARLPAERPPPCFIQSLEPTWLDPVGHGSFVILSSDEAARPTVIATPDIATCPACLSEVLDPANRRHAYPFTNCTHCGPRYTILESLPYDRERTSMRRFTMCEQCQAEYENPRDRRFHAQPNACPRCGPHLEFWDRNGRILASHRQALAAAAEALRHGSIVAVKGLGGFHLMVTALCENTVRGLRLLKHREEKPFAVMFPTLASLATHCEVSSAEERVLTSPEAPIVLLRRRRDQDALRDLHAAIVPAVAPQNPFLGAFLPTTPLHHLLLRQVSLPLVATSGNLANEPICTDEREALVRLRGIAEFFLVHNRPIVRPVDDSIVRVALGREMVLRRARGFAPLPLPPANSTPSPTPVVLAMGAHLKNTVALTVEGQVFPSQHIGDLESEAAFDALRRTAADLQHLYQARPTVVAADLHPDYLSTQYAAHLCQQGHPAPELLLVQHHHAHVLACAAENELAFPVLGVAWDGTGHGSDGTAWGGEFLRVNGAEFVRLAHLRSFPLPGGDRAAREPRRSAIGLLHEGAVEAWQLREDLAPVHSWTVRERTVLHRMLSQQLNSPRTSSAGRLFDAMAALLGLRQISRFEGQAAMDLEFACDPAETGSYAWTWATGSAATPASLDWGPLLQAVLEDLRRGESVARIAMRFHRSLAEGILQVAQWAQLPRVVLTGGCFQNTLLLELAVARLRAGGFAPYWHQRVPPNDGGISAGQALAALLGRASHTDYVPGHSRKN